jgi:ribonuclease Z
MASLNENRKGVAMITGMGRTDGQLTTSGGWPLPFTGKPMVTHPVIVKSSDGRLADYPDVFRPGEALGADEMRVTCTGSGNPVVRRGQAAASWLVEVGNGDKFVFDVGGGSVQNLFSLEIHPGALDKLFVTHGHLDHIGDLLVLFDAMGWARNTPLHVWGASGKTEAQGIASICRGFEAAAAWHIESKKGIVPSTGAVIVAHEFDSGAFSADNPETLVYDDNGVRIYAFPVMHCIYGAMGYRLEWNGLSVSFHGDGEPNSFEAQRVRSVDVMVHEGFLDAPTFAEKNGMPLEIAQNVLHAHTTPDMLGKLFEISRPRLGVGYHYFVNDDTIDPFFDGLTGTYGGPVALAQDLMVINVTPDNIVTRMGETDLLHWTPPPPHSPGPPPEPEAPSPAAIPVYVADTRLPN